MEAGGPIGPWIAKAGANSQKSQDEKDGRFTKEKGPKESHPNHAGSLPFSDQRIASGLGRELSAEVWCTLIAEASQVSLKAGPCRF